MNENEIAKIIVDAAFQVHKSLGPGLLESVYEVVLDYELKIGVIDKFWFRINSRRHIKNRKGETFDRITG